MALKRVDEFDGKTDATIVEFSVDGNTWQIDLSSESKRQLLRDLERYINAGRRVASKSKKSTPKKSPSTNQPADNTVNLDAVRDWAKRSPKFAGRKIADRGRVPKDIISAYEEDHSGSNVASPAFSGV